MPGDPTFEADQPCPGTHPIGHVNRGAFSSPEDVGQELLRTWLRRAKAAFRRTPNDCFEPFIYAWIAFNGWSARCTTRDGDREQLDALESDSALIRDFEAWKIRQSFDTAVRAFHTQWPIFRASDIRSRGQMQPAGPDRCAVVNRYLDVDPRLRRRPNCYEKHINEDKPVPVDWPHTLEAIYQVRCNLFHGEKASDSERDLAIVQSALKVLIPIAQHLLIRPSALTARTRAAL